MSRPKLLHLTTTAVSLDWLLSPQLVAFSSAGYDVITASAGGPHVESLRARGLDHHSVTALTRTIDPASDLRAVAELRRLLQHVQPDILHTHNPKPGVLGRVLGRSVRVPIVVNTVHGLYAQSDDSLLRRAVVYGAERVAASCSDAELVQNVEDIATLQSLGVPSSRLHLLGNGIDLDRFRPSETRSKQARQLRANLGIAPTMPVIGMVGRLVWEKGYREFFDAVTMLRVSRGATFEIVVVGPTENGKEGAVDARALAKMTDLGVRFLGTRTNVEALLASFDVFALPSHREGFPRAAMEACAMGLPVVATDIRGCRQVVEHERTGLLVPPRDATALANVLGRLLDDRNLRAELGAAARLRAAREFDQQRVIDRTLAVYRTLLRDKGLGTPQPRIERYKDSIDLVATAASNRVAEALAA